MPLLAMVVFSLAGPIIREAPQAVANLALLGDKS